jgi:predicted ATPase
LNIGFYNDGLLGMSESNWYVFTGRSCSGITRTLAGLKTRGFKILGEAARDLLDAKIAEGTSVQQMRHDEAAFQRQVLKMKVEREQTLSRTETYFFDRAVPDSVAYFSVAGIDPDEALAFCKRNLYRKIFFMEPLPYIRDYAGIENESTLNELGRSIRTTYTSLGYLVISIPVLPLDDRIRLVLSHIDSSTTAFDPQYR